ncbi:cysteine-rich DPF motif domain-containing protein 1 isoform X4 [Trichechus manatus latirostris]|uniref:Cysteine-rich DPF motif domain-containing protein 1 n=1 Tax=Trichechus manatus latirostris TaxID=127582 RepID=A0A2Y9R4I6_TRIMA|nr:cysteine-rich DPF motif domain-containing protein 1 isoform X4 [Trichechus manatus latirostris]
MASEAERRPQGVFECQLCALSAPYSYVGQKPPNTRSVVLLEESYVLKDPFTADRDKFLVLGSRCSVCSRLVCVGPEIRQDVDKRKALARTPCGKPSSRT